MQFFLMISPLRSATTLTKRQRQHDENSCCWDHKRF